MATPPPPSSPTASASASVSASPVSTKKVQPIPWTHQETVHLIRAYQEKWYALRRGQLKSSQWEEVAVTVAARCGYDHTEPSKTAIQCRHKMEKLRQRYRAEKNRVGLGLGSVWPYFDLMQRLERGPMPISARPMSVRQQEEEDEEEEEEEERDDRNGGDGDEDDDENYSKLQSIDYILRRPTIVNRFSGGKERYFRDSAPAAAKRQREDDGAENGDVAVEGQKGRGSDVRELAAEIRAFSRRLVGVESMRMEIMKETERCRLEMENKRIDMIVQSQRKIVDSIAKAFGSATNKLSS